MVEGREIGKQRKREWEERYKKDQWRREGSVGRKKRNRRRKNI